MMKLDAKALLAIGAISVAIALAAAFLLYASVGNRGLNILIVFVGVTALISGASVLVWLLNARQIRADRAHGVKLILRDFAKRDASFRAELNSLREVLETVRKRNGDLDERQRKLQNVIRSEYHTSRERLAEIIVAQRDLQAGVDGILEQIAIDGTLGHEVTSLNSRVHEMDGAIQSAELRDREILNLVRGEIHNSKARADALQRALTAQGDSTSKAIAKVEDASVAVKKMHNFLRRDGSIQIALDRFTAAERRMLAAVETAGLDHADQVAALHSTVLTGFAKESPDIARLEENLTQGLQNMRTELFDGVVNLATELDNLSALVADAIEREANEAFTPQEGPIQDSTIIDGRLRGFYEKLSALLEILGFEDRYSSVESGAPSSEGESATGDAILLSEVTRANESSNRAVAQAQTGKLERFIKRQSIDVVRQVEALGQLLPRVQTGSRRYPPLGWWALPADTVLFLSDYIERERPKRILEIGSGSSTVWIGTFAERVGAQVVSLEHDYTFAQKSRDLVDAYGLQDVATVRHAALRQLELGGKTFNWYDLEVVESLEGPFDVLVVDGPPESTGDSARMPALPVLEHLLSSTCLVLLDDTHRPAEQEILKKWAEREGRFEYVDSDLMRTGVLRRQR